MFRRSLFFAIAIFYLASAAFADDASRHLRRSLLIRGSDGRYHRVGGRSADIAIPFSSIPRHAFRAHTNHLHHVGKTHVQHAARRQSSLFAHPSDIAMSISGYHPSDIRTVYGVSGGGQGVIAIVDAYHYANALHDFNLFSSTFGLPTESSGTATSSSNSVFQVVYQNGSPAATDSGWNEEAALDIEWAHAMAPNAKIVLVEADSSSGNDLLAAVNIAANLTGVTQISMSWGSSEFSGEASLDSYFAKSGVTYFASSGDTGGIVEWPSVSVNVVAVGGTRVTITAGGSRSSETGWTGAGGGISSQVSRPSYQNGLSGLLGTHRGVPDIGAIADPATGVAVYVNSSWLVFGGTSVAAPVWAGIANAQNIWSDSSAAHSSIYADQSSFYDVTSGTAGSFSCSAGYDLVTGEGAPAFTSVSPTATPTPTRTASPTPSTPPGTATPVPSPTPTSPVQFTPVPTSVPTVRPTATPTRTATRTPTKKPTPKPRRPRQYWCYKKISSHSYRLYFVTQTSRLRRLAVHARLRVPPAGIRRCPF